MIFFCLAVNATFQARKALNVLICSFAGLAHFNGMQPSKQGCVAASKKAGSRSRGAAGNGNCKKSKINEKQVSLTISNAGSFCPSDSVFQHFMK